MRVSGILPAIHEEEISPEQMGNYKVELHRLFLGWANKIARNSTYEIEKGAPERVEAQHGRVAEHDEECFRARERDCWPGEW